MIGTNIVTVEDVFPSSVPVTKFQMVLPTKPARGEALQVRVSVP